jgi:beta-N-acetylhexosaminidase
MSAALAVLLPGFVGTTLPPWLESRLRDGLAGVCIFGENIESREQLRALTDAIRAANPAALIAIDEEGGDVTRLYYDQGSPYPGNALLGRIDDVGLTRTVARTVGAQLREVGVNLDFAPSVDVNSNPDNPVIGVRSFGADPQLVARHSAAWVAGIESSGVASSAKHFPGHGDTALDSHLSLPVVDESLEVLLGRELPPFIAAIEAGASTIMTSHISLPQLDEQNPATFSREILEHLLRGELGFAGVIVSDALDMVGASGEHGIPEAAVRAIMAGCDLLCIGTKNTDEQLSQIAQALEQAVGEDRLPAERLASAGTRNRTLASRLAPPSGGRESEPAFDLARTAAAFEVTGTVVVARVHTIVALDTVTNIAVGSAPWGPPAHVRLREGDPLPEVVGQLVLVGKDNHRHEWVRAVIDAARARAPHTVVIDMGWPAADRNYADVATFGASRHVGEALSAWLGEAAR